MAHKYIQVPHFEGVYNSKDEAISSIEKEISENGGFMDNENISFDYLSNGIVLTANATVNIDSNGNVSLYVPIFENETLKIVESDTEPKSNNTLWLTSSDTKTDESIRADLDDMKKALNSLIDVVNRHTYAFENELNGGTLYNSVKYREENSAEQEEPSSGESEYEITDYGEAEEPSYEEYKNPTYTHLLIKTAESEAQILSMAKYLCDNELVWCPANNGLYIKSNSLIIKINGTSSDPLIPVESGDTGDTPTVEITIINLMEQSGVTFNENLKVIESITFVSPNNRQYEITIDDDGKFQSELVSGNTTGKLYNTTLSSDGTQPAPLFQKTNLLEGGLFLNSFYCGGVDSDEHSYNRCSHNFVELANTTKSGICLNGLSVIYYDSGETQTILPLKGYINSGSTFLIRGAQCSVMDVNYTKIKVNTYDMEWYTDSGKTELIKFDRHNCAFYLQSGTTKYTGHTYNDGTKSQTANNPYGTVISNVPKLNPGYIDLVGAGNSAAITWYESAITTSISSSVTNDRIVIRYYAMDPVKQANKATSARTNNGEWTFIDLNKENGDVIPSIDVYRPMASSEHKNIFYNKTNLNEETPTIVTCTFGIKATANKGFNGDIVPYNGNNYSATTYGGATRCFNWVSKGVYDEYIWIRPEGSEDWTVSAESINDTTRSLNEDVKLDSDTNRVSGNPTYYYNRLIQEYTNGDVFTAHKSIMYNIAAGTYEYVVGRSLDKCSEIRKFTVKTVSDTVKFVQTTDQQGFNWEEYQVWKASSNFITDFESDIDFMINTGDMTQNGNRLNEWIDYFDAKSDDMNNMPEMATIGNNDLSPEILYKLGNGNDTEKYNHTNILFFYTFELDYKNLPLFWYNQKFNYIPSLYSYDYGNIHFMSVNSEITYNTENTMYGFDSTSAKTGYVYPYVKSWCERDISGHTGTKIAYCHEMPFTILTQDKMDSWGTYDKTSGYTCTYGKGKTREGSHFNINAFEENAFWFSEFCQDNGISLVIGGHKHTGSCTWPLKENIIYLKADTNGSYVIVSGNTVCNKGVLSSAQLSTATLYSKVDKGTEGAVRIVQSFMPIIQITSNMLSATTGFNSDRLVTINQPNSVLDGNQYPSAWFNSNVTGTTATTSDLNTVTATTIPYYALDAYYCTFELVSAITAPIYSMSQATGYKTTSNKELPGDRIVWNHYYFPRKSSSKGNDGQLYPFYTVWTINGATNSIVGNTYKISGIFNSSGKFAINAQYKNTREGALTISNRLNGLYDPLRGANENNIVVR